MKNTISLLLVILAFSSCQNESKIKIQKTSVKVIDGKTIKTTSDDYLTSDYFEISLEQYSDDKDNHKYFLARKVLEEPKSVGDFKMEFLTITDDNSENIQFSNSTEFLNFMSKNGYEMQSQEKYKYRTEYTFKKK